MGTFNHKYIGGSFKPALVKKVGNEARNIKSVDETKYVIHEKLLDRPVVKKFRIMLEPSEVNVDFRKPVYIEEFGCNCMILEILASKTGMCEVKVLLINKTLV